MESARSSSCRLLCRAKKLCQAGPRCGLPLSRGIEEVMQMAILQKVLQWMHQSTELLAWCRSRVKWFRLVHCCMISRRSDMTAPIIAPHPLNFIVVALLTRGSCPSALDKQLRRAPIINGEGMGANLPYLWLGSGLCYVATMCYVAPHLIGPSPPTHVSSSMTSSAEEAHL
jgi:hypothetical protein